MHFANRFESLERLGFNSFFQRQLLIPNSDAAAPSAGVARVLAESRGQYLVSNGEGLLSAVLAGRLQYERVRACVGDFVLLGGDSEGGLSRIVQVFERSSLFQRRVPVALRLPN